MLAEPQALPHPHAVAVSQNVDRRTAQFVVPELHCAGCIARIERHLAETDGIEAGRVNLSLKQATITWDPRKLDENLIVDALANIGFTARVYHAGTAPQTTGDEHSRLLLRSLAVAGFAAGNVMLLSVSVWSGAEAATRELLHWISAMIALPAVIYAGQPFYRSALTALANRQLNMDVPISLAVILAAGMSLFETSTGGATTYFDAAVMLLFFLLAGRTLDHMMRTRARSALSELVALQATGANVVGNDGSRTWRAICDIRSGMQIAVTAGDRMPVDGRVVDGHSDLDRSIVTGESAPEAIGPGSTVEAGTTNLTGPLTLEVTAVGDHTVLAEITRLMGAAERGRARFVRLADRAARIYAPVVHIAAALTFIAWLFASGAWHFALLTAIAVLIITCPCALGLAVPAVQIVAAGRLFRRGVLVKDGAALERLAEIDTVVFDKTGTLTGGRPRLAAMDAMPCDDLAVAAGLAAESRHPLATALTRQLAERGIAPADVRDIEELPGFGMSGLWQGEPVRLGSRDWCGGKSGARAIGPELWLGIGGKPPRAFAFEDDLRADAAATVAKLKDCGLRVVLLSGDRSGAVDRVARETGIIEAYAGWKPRDKAAFIQSLQDAGQKVLMVGDGINDAPALAAAHASMAPSSAADISGNCAGIIFLGSRLGSVLEAWTTARSSRRLVHQNFGLAALYNLLAIPVAVAGLASPLVAAVAMSASSLVVTGNALRLHWGPRP